MPMMSHINARVVRELHDIHGGTLISPRRSRVALSEADPWIGVLIRFRVAGRPAARTG